MNEIFRKGNLKFRRSAVTGPAASGKTTLCEQLRSRGSIVISWDDVYKDLLLHSEILRKTLIQEFSLDLVESSETGRPGDIKCALNAAIFDDEKLRSAKLKRLNEITHPIIKKVAFELEDKAVEKFYSSNQQLPDPDSPPVLVVHEVPLLYQARLDSLFPRIYICLADEQTLIRRLAARNNLSTDLAEKKVKATLYNFPIYSNKVIVIRS